MLPGIGQPIKSSGRGAISLWTLEWTYTNGAGAVLLDATKSDQDARVATPVATGGTGLTLIRFPKSRNARVYHCSVEEPVVGVSVQVANVFGLDPVNGAVTFRVATGASAAQATSGSRGRLTLALDYE